MADRGLGGLADDLEDGGIEYQEHDDFPYDPPRGPKITEPVGQARLDAKQALQGKAKGPKGRWNRVEDRANRGSNVEPIVPLTMQHELREARLLTAAEVAELLAKR